MAKFTVELNYKPIAFAATVYKQAMIKLGRGKEADVFIAKMCKNLNDWTEQQAERTEISVGPNDKFLDMIVAVRNELEEQGIKL